MKTYYLKYVAIAAAVLIPMSASAAGVTAYNGNGGGVDVLANNIGSAADSFGWGAVTIAGVVGAILFITGLINAYKILKAEGGQQDGWGKPIGAMVIGVMLLSVVAMKGMVSTTLTGQSGAQGFNQTTGAPTNGRAF